MDPIQPSADPISQQHDLEVEMTMMGVEAYRQRMARAVENGQEDSTTYGTAMVDGLIHRVKAKLEELVAERASGKAGRKGPAFKYLKLFEDRMDAVAFIALRIVISTLSSKNNKFPALAQQIARALEDEHTYGQVRKDDKKFYDQLRKESQKRSAIHVKRNVVNMFIRRREMWAFEEWPERHKMVLGATIVEAIISSTGIIEKRTESVINRKNKTVTVIQATDHARAFIEKRNAAAEITRPLYEPMIVPPGEWSTPFNGGYLTHRVSPVRFMKVRSKNTLKSLAEMDLTDAYAAVNAAQRTAWTINPFVLTVLEMAYDNDHSIGGIPPKYNLPVPIRPDLAETDEEVSVAWRKEASATHRENRVLDSQRTAFVQGITTARRYMLFDKIYMPYQLDFRGRIYAVPRLNPQGPDWMKALLMFAEGKPIDEESAPWLAIQVANTGAFEKMDKAPLEDRVQWVYDNEEKIIACADNPFEHRWWTEADSPYCFLAACREWAGWLREGAGFISHLPVALDGSCSGIQHFSMALADEVGGAAVNLVPAEKPADIYSLVMEQAIAQVRLDASTCGDNQEMAKAWLRSGLMTRSLFKRPTMTYGYGSGQFGFRDQIETDTLKPAHRAYQRGEGAWFFEDQGFKASLYMASVTHEAVERTVLKAAEAMKWLKEVARVVTSDGLPVRWVTPDGLPILQSYNKTKAHRVDTMIYGSRVTMQVNETVVSREGPQVDPRKQASGLSPNFVHALDATHLRLAVRQAADEGITDVALVHDSFGTHAADTSRFFTILRESLVRLYTEHDVMHDFYLQMRAQVSPDLREKVPHPPTKGSLDITSVIESDFAFA